MKLNRMKVIVTAMAVLFVMTGSARADSTAALTREDAGSNHTGQGHRDAQAG